MLCEFLTPQYDISSGCGWKRLLPYMEGSFEYIE